VTTDVRHSPAAVSRWPAPLAARIYGLGSVFGKTLRDSRRAWLMFTGFIVLMVLIVGSATAATFGTVASRQDVVRLSQTLPQIILGLYGGPAVNVETLGGLMSWRYGLLFFLLPGFWSILALSGTIVGEGRRGSLDLLAAQGFARRRLAVEKIAAHVVAMTAALTVIAVAMFIVGAVFKTLPGDEIPLGAAFGYALLMGLGGLAAGAIAFALAPLVGRGAAAGVAAVLLLGGWIISGYREAIPVFDTLAPLSWFSWTVGHRPIAGISDWPSLIPLAAIVVAGLAIGVLIFERRDLAAVGSVRTPGLPRAILGLRGPIGRTFGERFPTAMAWGMGLGLYGLAIASSGEALRVSIAENPSIAEMIRIAFPTIDLNDPGFGLQLAFLSFGYLAAGLAAATLIGGWASDETDGRLEFLLVSPISRFRWFVSSGLGVFASIILVAVVVAIGIGLGVATTRQSPWTAAFGTAVLGLYGCALAGIGIAVAGVLRSSLAVSAVAAGAMGTLLLDIIVPALQLPAWVHDLALTAHFGEPMVGNWDPVGIVASIVIALGGLGIGAWGFSRRDLGS
jgi:ABC-2 type transport system permease protein